MWPLFIVVATMSILTGAQTAPPPCEYSAVDPATKQEFRYNFASMKAATPSDYWPVDYPADNEHGKLNLCAPLVAPCTSANTPLCLSTPAATETSLGTMNSWKLGPYYDPRTRAFSYQSGVVATISGGQPCSNWNTELGSAYIFLKCNPQVTAKMTSVPITDIDPSTGMFTPCRYYAGPIEHAAFCPVQGNPFDYGWVFVIIVLCGFFLYFLIGILILKFALHKEGREIVPNHELWTSLPGLVWDGLKFLFSKFQACCCSRGGYENV